MAQIEIKTDGIRTKMIVDGIEISGLVNRYSLVHEGGSCPVLDVSILASDITVDTAGVVRFPERIAQFIEPWGKNHSAASGATTRTEVSFDGQTIYEKEAAPADTEAVKTLKENTGWVKKLATAISQNSPNYDIPEES